MQRALLMIDGNLEIIFYICVQACLIQNKDLFYSNKGFSIITESKSHVGDGCNSSVSDENDSCAHYTFIFIPLCSAMTSFLNVVVQHPVTNYYSILQH